MSKAFSVIMPCHNHEQFLPQAIESVLEQKFSHGIELLIGDDVSLDDSRNVILKYARKYPSIVKPIFYPSKVGAMMNQISLHKLCKGDYVAYLEGDDYWTDPNKIALIYDQFKSLPNVTLISHLNSTLEKGKIIPSSEYDSNYPITQNEIVKHGSVGATCTLAMRRDSVNPLPDWFSTLSGGDWAIQLVATRSGSHYKISKDMAVYRRHDQGRSAATSFEKMHYIYYTGGVVLCKQLDQGFNLIHHREFLVKIREFYQTLISVVSRHKFGLTLKYLGQMALIVRSGSDFEQWIQTLKDALFNIKQQLRYG